MDHLRTIKRLLCIIGVFQTVSFGTIWKHCENRKIDVYRGLNTVLDITDMGVHIVDKPNGQVKKTSMKMPIVVIEKMYDDKSVYIKSNNKFSTKMPFIDTISLEKVFTLVCLLLFVFTPESMLPGKINILNKSNANENKMCWKKEKSAYDSIFSFRKVPQSLIIAMLPSPQRGNGYAPERSTAKQIVGSNDIPTYRNARNPDFIDKNARDESFYNWPLGTDAPDIDSLSYAGFYYLGHADTVRCFYCAGGLSGIEFDTDPLAEHLKYYPSCEYIRYITGNSEPGPSQPGPRQPGPRQTGSGNHQQGAATGGYDSKPSSRFGERQEMSSSSNYKPQEKSNPRPNDTTAILQKSDIKDLLTKGVSRKQIEELILKQLEISNKDASSTTDSLFLKLQSNEPQNIAVVTANKTSEQPSTNQDVKQTSVPDGDQGAEGGHKQIYEEEKQSLKTSEENEDGGVSIIKRENHQLKEQMLCKICLDKKANVVFLNCGHMVSCPECSPHIRKCPICRKLIKSRIQVS